MCSARVYMLCNTCAAISKRSWCVGNVVFVPPSHYRHTVSLRPPSYSIVHMYSGGYVGGGEESRI
jgi:hypothetical protein